MFVRPLSLVLLGASLILIGVRPTAAQAPGPFTVVASGLDNPRGLGLGWGGVVYVAEAGTGGNGVDFCVEGPEGTPVCYGETGALTAITRHGQRRIVTGLPSLAPASGQGAEGPEDVVSSWAGLFLLVGLGNAPSVRDDLPPGADDLGQLLRVRPRKGSWEPFADIAAFEEREDPDGDQPGTAIDSNPVSVIRSHYGFSVVDAGGNSLVDVDWAGNVSLSAVFPVRFLDFPVPMFPMESVPTSVARGRDRALYVGELTGFPFPEGLAQIYRVTGPEPEPAVFGFTHVLDLAFDRNGDLYVLQIASSSLTTLDLTGALIRVAPDGTREELSQGSLFAPTGLALDPHRGALYISDCGVCPGAGRVLRLDLDRPENGGEDSDDDDD